MKRIRRVPFVLLSSIFVSSGLDAAIRPQGKVDKAAAVTEPVIEALGLPTDDEQLVRVNGAVQVVAGLMLAGGVLPRVAAAVLAASLVPTTLAGHRFWAQTDPRDRVAQRTQFRKNLAILGGLLLVVGGAGSGGRGERAPEAASH